MSDPVVEALILDLLEWVRQEERVYDDVMEAWRTSCPKLPVWEDANDRGLVAQQWVEGRCVVRITEAGRSHLEALRPANRSIGQTIP
jgi:DNA-binding PadR family transcriptional regulator